MKRIVLFLSGVWDRRIDETISDDDLIVCAAGLRPGDRKFLPLETRSGEPERLLADWLAEAVKTSQVIGQPLVSSFLNDYYAYSLRPALGVIVALQSIIERENVSRILVVMAKTDSDIIPMIGFQTAESLRGSKSLLNSRIGRQLPKIFPNLEFDYILSRGDVLCNEKFRRFAVAFANMGASAFFLVKLALNWFSPGNAGVSVSSNFVVLVRTAHQLRFGMRLTRGCPSVAFAVMPQVSQGSIRSYLKLRRAVPSEITLVRASLINIYRAVRSTTKDLQSIRCYLHNVEASDFVWKNLRIPVRLHDLASEISLISTTLLYKNLLAEILQRSNFKRLINFELVGRMAGLEALAARCSGVETFSVQTALISANALPIFPYCTEFYADSLTTLKMIASNGSYRIGNVAYAGPPYPLGEMKVPGALQRITYFTQPYEPEETNEILNTLCVWASAAGAMVTLRCHPRDNENLYAELLENYAGVLNLDSGGVIDELIASSDLCVTRTSSVAKEAIALGRPVILCLWSPFDLAIKADYILKQKDLGYIANSPIHLEELLGDLEGLSVNARALSLSMFGGKCMGDLQHRLFN